MVISATASRPKTERMLILMREKALPGEAGLRDEFQGLAGWNSQS